MNDLRDVFGTSNPAAQAQQQALVKVKKTAKELSQELGLSREVLALIGNAPPTVIAKPVLKPIVRLTRSTKWEWRDFTNSARGDGLILQHWIKANEKEDDYRFVIFNKRPDIVQYTQDEYDQLLTGAEWSRKETDYLFNLCRQFDLRFLVIHDRYEYLDKERTIEDLKERYYRVSQKLLTARQVPGDSTQKSVIAALTFDKEKETARKLHLAGLLARTAEEVTEEEYLFTELRKMEDRQSKITRDRSDIINRLFKGVEPSELAAYHMKRRKVLKDAPMFTNSLDAMRTSTIASGNTTSKQIEGVTATTEKLLPGTSLRTSKAATIKPSLLPKYMAIMGELGLKPVDRPRMPSSAVLSRFEELKANIIQLLELKKQFDKLDADYKVHHHRREMLDSNNI